MTDPIATPAVAVRTAHAGEPGHPRRPQRSPQVIAPHTCSPADAVERRPRRAFPGGKNADGVYQLIINQIPPHAHYLELFAGSAAILIRKRPAPGLNLAIEADAPTTAALELTPPRQVILDDAFSFLSHYPAFLAHPHVCIYADPPYPLETRQGRRYYAHELTDADHVHLLDALTHARAMVLISGYRCPLYDHALQTWRRIDYHTMTRGGSPRVESLWMNFPQPQALHDYQYLGNDFRERERIRKLIRRWRRRLDAMPALQRAALRAALLDGHA